VRVLAVWVWLLPVSILFSGCRTLPEVPAVDLAEPGWTIHQGQALWRPSRTAPEIAGDLLLARNQNGRSLVQFTKTPFPILTGQTTPAGWRIEFLPQRRSYSGHGEPPARLIWLYLANCLLDHAAPPRNWVVERQNRDALSPWELGKSQADSASLQFRFRNESTGETLEGFLGP
jgi:hypothetical protein